MPVSTLPPAEITIPFEELQGSPKESVSGGMFTATRELKCAWANRITLMKQFAGVKSFDGTDTIITLPQLYPHAFYSDARVTGVEINPWGKVGPIPGLPPAVNAAATYEHCAMTVQYSSPTIQNSGGGSGDPDGAEVDESIEPFTEFLTLPNRQLTWADGTPLETEEAPAFQMRGANWVYTKKAMFSVPVATLSLTGKVNAAPVTALTLGVNFAAETLLYNPPILRRSNAVGGGWDIEYRFTYKPNGWNKYFNVNTWAWEEVYSVAGVLRKPYPTGDFTLLVR